jgi:hypothetical protein
MSFEWAVGLFEGEGSLFKDKRNNTWTLQMRMTDKDVVQMFADVMGTGGKVHDESGQPRRILTGRKACYRWTCSRKTEVTRIVLKMLPLLGDRRAHKVLDCLDTYENKND